jgi:hypothetical protein
MRLWLHNTACLACFTPFIKMALLAVSDRLVSSHLKIFLGGIPSAVISFVMVAELVVLMDRGALLCLMRLAFLTERSCLRAMNPRTNAFFGEIVQMPEVLSCQGKSLPPPPPHHLRPQDDDVLFLDCELSRAPQRQLVFLKLDSVEDGGFWNLVFCSLPQCCRLTFYCLDCQVNVYLRIPQSLAPLLWLIILPRPARARRLV